MGLCIVVIINKGIEYQCNFFVGPWHGPALLGMPDCERLQMLSTNCWSTNGQQEGRQINEQTKQDKSKKTSSFKDILHTKNKTEQEIDYLIDDPGTEANSVKCRNNKENVQWI